MGKALEELRRRFPGLADELWAEAMEKAEVEMGDSLDQKIAEAIDAEKEAMRGEAEDIILEIAAQREAEYCGVLREIMEAICAIPGVIGEEEDDEPEDQEVAEEDEETDETEDGEEE